MRSLPDLQANFIETINGGPHRLDAGIFEGPQDRVFLGLKAHANTVSHARLIALEETFPLTRQQIGEAAFNELSREYVETETARSMDSNRIGRNFIAFLRDFPINAVIVQLAAVEWAWLECYHAADAPSLTAADLAGHDEETLLAMQVALHPSARVVKLTAPLASALDELATQQPDSLLAICPDAEVRLVGLDACHAALLTLASEQNCTLGNLIELAFEVAGEQAPLGPILYLVGAGALIKTG